MKHLAQAGVPIGETFNSPFGQTLTIGNLVSVLVEAAFAIAGVIFIFLLVAGGIGIMAGAGNDNPEQVTKGKQAITSALIGFIIVFAAFWIVRLIEEIIGVKIITAPGI